MIQEVWHTICTNTCISRREMKIGFKETTFKSSDLLRGKLFKNTRRSLSVLYGKKHERALQGIFKEAARDSCRKTCIYEHLLWLLLNV